MTSVLYGRDAQARAVLALLEGARAGRRRSSWVCGRGSGFTCTIPRRAGISPTRRTG